MADYSKGKIYCVKYRLDPSLIYVGSTIRTLNKRWGEHKSDIELAPCCIFHKKIIETNDINNWYIELYENYPCKNEKELRRREGEVTKLIGTLNKNIAGRTHKETMKYYYENNREKFKEYRENNKQKIAEKMKEPITCECGCIIKGKCNLNRHKKSNKHINLMNKKSNDIIDNKDGS